jgi:hypothetical protein
MFSYGLMRFLMLPGFLMRRGPRAYYAGSLAVQVIGLATSLVWLMTPAGLGQAYGHWWMLLWLVPTAAVIYCAALGSVPGGG